MNAVKTNVMMVESMQRRRPQVGGTAAPAPSFTCDLSMLELVEEFTYLYHQPPLLLARFAADCYNIHRSASAAAPAPAAAAVQHKKTDWEVT